MTDFTGLKWTHGQSDWDVQFNAAMDLATSATTALETFQNAVGATSATSQGIPAIGGTMSFTINETGRSFTVGSTYQAYRLSAPSTVAIGTAASWNNGTKALSLTMTQSTATAGPFTDWVIVPVAAGALPVQAGNANGSAVTNGSSVTWQPLAQVKTRSGAATVSLATAVISAGGTGYAVNDTITLAGGTGTAAVLTVTSVSAGVITGLSIKSPGLYTAAPASPAGQGSTSGSGVGATVTITTATGYSLVAGGGSTGDLSVTQDFTGGGVLTVPAMSTLQANYVAWVCASGGAVKIYSSGGDTLNGVAATPITVAQGNIAEIIVTSVGTPGNARVIQFGGPVLINTGAANTIVASTTLTAASAQLQNVTMASANQVVTLPDATTLQKGAAPFVLACDPAGFAFILRDSTGKLIANPIPGDIVTPGLGDNPTAAGVWRTMGAVPATGLLNAPTVISSAASPGASAWLTGTTFAAFVNNGSALTGVVGTVGAAGALSFASPTVSAVNVTPIGALAFTPTSGIVWTATTIYAWSLAGSTFTFGAGVRFAINRIHAVKPIPASTTNFVALIENNSGTMQLIPGSIAGTVVSSGAAMDVTGTLFNRQEDVAVLSATKALVVSGGVLSVITLSGLSAPTLASSISVFDSVGLYTSDQSMVCAIDGVYAVVIYPSFADPGAAYAATMRAAVVNTVTKTMSVGAPFPLLSSAWMGAQTGQRIKKVGGKIFVLLTQGIVAMAVDTVSGAIQFSRPTSIPTVTGGNFDASSAGAIAVYQDPATSYPTAARMELLP